MLHSLYIENIAVIEKAGIEFDSGLNVLTGETGAGKSIVIDAIHAALGERTSRDIIRTGAGSAHISVLYRDLPASAEMKLEELGYEAEDGELLIQRNIGADGKSVCRVGGRPATVSALRELGRFLINIHGQHDNQDLLSPDRHIVFIDKLADIEADMDEYRALYKRLRSIEKKLSELHMNEADKAHKLDLLTYQIGELEEADLKVGERERLLSQRTKISNAEKIISNLNMAYEALNGSEAGSGALARLGEAAFCLREIQRFDLSAEDLANRIEEISYELQEICGELRDGFSDLESDPGELDRIESRLDVLYRLSRKYGATEEDMIVFLEKAREELNGIVFADEMILKLENERREVYNAATQKAREISAKRRKAGEAFVREICEELSFLEMPGVRFVVSQGETELTASGMDTVEFLISANLGEEPKPLSKIASGGELSRIMLAIKNVLADKDEVGTLIFDEIDTGVSGRAAQKIGRKLRQVSSGRQVICVTHSAQIAAAADAHMLIEKSVRDGRTYTNVKKLDFQGRKKEIARIMGGLNITELMLRNAEEMLRAGE